MVPGFFCGPTTTLAALERLSFMERLLCSASSRRASRWCEDASAAAIRCPRVRTSRNTAAIVLGTDEEAMAATSLGSVGGQAIGIGYPLLSPG